jgi:hypothetical protein
MTFSLPLEIILISLAFVWLFAMESPYTLDGYIRFLLRLQFEEQLRQRKKNSHRRLLRFSI